MNNNNLNKPDSVVAEENLKQFNRIDNAILKASESIGITKEQGWNFFEVLTSTFGEK